MALCLPHAPPVAHTQAVVVVVGDVVAVVDDQVDETHSSVGLAVAAPGLGDDEAPGDVGLGEPLLVPVQGDQRRLGGEEEAVTACLTAL